MQSTIKGTAHTALCAQPWGSPWERPRAGCGSPGQAKGGCRFITQRSEHAHSSLGARLALDAACSGSAAVQPPCHQYHAGCLCSAAAEEPHARTVQHLWSPSVYTLLTLPNCLLASSRNTRLTSPALSSKDTRQRVVGLLLHRILQVLMKWGVLGLTPSLSMYTQSAISDCRKISAGLVHHHVPLRHISSCSECSLPCAPLCACQVW